MATLRKRGPYQWEAQIRRRGWPAQSKTFESKAEAEAWAQMIESEMARGVWLDRSEAENTTLRELLDRYEKEISPRKRSYEREVSFLNTWRQTELAARMVSRIRGSDIAALRDDWLMELAPASVLRRLQVLSHVFNTARKEWGMESLANPVELITKPTPDNERERRVSLSEMESIIAATGSRFLPAMLRIAVQSAVRRGELVGLCWENVHLDGDAPYLHLPMTKNGDSRNVPLLPDVVKAIKSWRSAVVEDLEARAENSDPLRGRVFPIRADAVTRAFGRARDRARSSYEAQCREAGVPVDAKFLHNLTFHDSRHEATTQLATLVDGTDLAKITGHRDPRMLMRYYHPTPEELSAKISRSLAKQKREARAHARGKALP
ncbi:tyrosine-type recombinase/integrase [Pseudoxanthomonas sp. 10H]|uniref:tyrosine-type recombinase/integrase n=1 Tax=Pseudoxanthomonas sp. 10H TaxID=3242729 RepID=UPI00355876BC